MTADQKNRHAATALARCVQEIRSARDGCPRQARTAFYDAIRSEIDRLDEIDDAEDERHSDWMLMRNGEVNYVGAR